MQRLAAWSLILLCSLAPITALAAEEPDNKAVVTGTVVDEAGNPVASATVSKLGALKQEPVTTAADGTFHIPASRYQSQIYAPLLVESKGHLGFLPVYQTVETQKPVRIVLKPAHKLSVKVLDAQGSPISDAEIVFLASMSPFRSGKTNAEGLWTSLVPADLQSWSLYARKPGAGFDFAASEQPSDGPTAQKPLPHSLTLSLTGAKSVRVKVVDRNGNPLSGVPVGVWYIRLPGRDVNINLSGDQDNMPLSNEEGIAILDWIPLEVDRQLSVVTYSETHYAQDHATLVDTNAGVDEVTITLLPTEKLSGRVIHADGRPAANIEVTAHGQGIGHNNGRGATQTDALGRYEMNVYSEQAYIVAAGNKEWAASYRDDVVVRAGKPVDGVDFTLVPATRLHGQVTVGKDNNPVPETSITAAIDSGPIPAELEAQRPEGDTYWYGVSMHLWSQTDDQGRFEYYLGPGDYELRGPAHTEPVTITIPAENPPAEIEQNFHMERPETGPFAVLVVDTAGNPVADIGVTGVYQSMKARRGWHHPINTDTSGGLTTERSLDPLVLHARTADKQLAGITRVDAETSQAKIVVTPTASATGTLLDLDGNPLADKKLNYGILIHIGEENNSPFTYSFGGNIVTDADGRFELIGLIPGEKYEVDLQFDDRSSRTIATAKPESASPLDLGEIKADPDSALPYAPPTPDKRTADAFAAKADTPTKERIDDLLAEAGREYTRPLLLIGRPSDPAAIDLYRLFYDDNSTDELTEEERADESRLRTPRELRWEFELAALNVERSEVVEELGLDPDTTEPSALVILNTDGTAAARYELILNDEKQLDRDALARFLTEHKLPTRDAEQMLAEAFTTAKSENKRVFLISSASWCGPCRFLSRFLDPHKEELQQYFLFVKLDTSRDKSAPAVRDRYQGELEGGVPWYVILDAEGNTLITSNMPSDDPDLDAQNIGFPGDDPAAVNHFLNMLKTTAPNLPSQLLTDLQTALIPPKDPTPKPESVTP